MATAADYIPVFSRNPPTDNQIFTTLVKHVRIETVVQILATLGANFDINPEDRTIENFTGFRYPESTIPNLFRCLVIYCSPPRVIHDYDAIRIISALEMPVTFFNNTISMQGVDKILRYTVLKRDLRDVSPQRKKPQSSSDTDEQCKGQKKPEVHRLSTKWLGNKNRICLFVMKDTTRGLATNNYKLKVLIHWLQDSLPGWRFKVAPAIESASAVIMIAQNGVPALAKNATYGYDTINILDDTDFSIVEENCLETLIMVEGRFPELQQAQVDNIVRTIQAQVKEEF